MVKYDISVVLGSKNRRNLIKATIASIRENGFSGRIEIIVIDGGSTDGTCDWLALQTDIVTIIQPNYNISTHHGISKLAHSWGEFMNIGFKYASSPWIVMISDDLILTKGVLQKGYDHLVKQAKNGSKIGGGAFYFREYPRHSYYRLIMLPGNIININHGFYNREALIDVNFTDEKNFNFYCADGDLVLRMHEKGWQIIELADCYVEHLVHLPQLRKKGYSPATLNDIDTFNKKYPLPCSNAVRKKHAKIENNRRVFWKVAFFNCIMGIFVAQIDKFLSLQRNHPSI
jgi:glycosyltransferase involved in cell wall biosynthesis